MNVLFIFLDYQHVTSYFVSFSIPQWLAMYINLSIIHTFDKLITRSISAWLNGKSFFQWLLSISSNWRAYKWSWCIGIVNITDHNTVTRVSIISKHCLLGQIALQALSCSESWGRFTSSVVQILAVEINSGSPDLPRKKSVGITKRNNCVTYCTHGHSLLKVGT